MTEEKENKENKAVQSITSQTMSENFDNADALSTSSPKKDIDVEIPPKKIFVTDNPISA